MCTTSSQIVYGFRNGSMCESEITENIFDRCLYTYCSSVPELMVRTSGEHRLSDFLMWQVSAFAIFIRIYYLFFNRISRESIFMQVLFYSYSRLNNKIQNLIS